jgi:PAS domain S-box-containing protein
VLILIVTHEQEIHLEAELKEYKNTCVTYQKSIIRDKVDQANSEKNTLIGIAIFVTLMTIFVTIICARRIAKKLDNMNHELQLKVNEQITELQDNLGFMNKLLDTVPVPVFIKDENFRYIKCNAAFCKFLNLSKEEIIGKNVYDLSPKDLAEIYHKKDLELIEAQNQFYKSEIDSSKINKRKIVEFYKASFKHNDKFAGIIGVIIDVTLKDEKKLKLKATIFDKTMQNIEQIKQFEKEQLKNIKFTAIGQLAAGITHEINTPLTYIKGNFEMIQYDIEDLPSSDIKVRMKKIVKK